jgi:peptidyl-dipeptidase Dcp
VQLENDKRNRLRELDAEIATLTSEFRDNLLQESNDATMLITREADLAGVSQNLIDIAAKAASEKGLEGWLFTANRITLYPFLTTAESREHRRQLYHAYTHRGCNGNEQDNRKLAEQMATLRVEKANILGYDCYAEYALEAAMAKTPEQVLSFLDQIWAASSYSANEEAKALTEYLERDGVEGPLEAWDWWYYAEKVRVEQYDLSEDEVRPYFSLDNVMQGAFTVARRLFKIDFVERTDMPIYHPDVRVFEVQQMGTQEVIGILYVDYFARSSKRGGAWMSSFQIQHKMDGNQIPIVINVCNFPPPTQDAPSLLSSGHVKTLFHELGHALHGLLSSVQYPTLSGTNVVMDYVEFPSQLMENWGKDPAVVREYALHYETSEPMPQELMDKMAAAGNFNQGFMTSEYLAASYLDLAWHMQTGPSKSSEEIEQQVIDRIGLRPQIGFRYRSTYFAHIFAGGYASFYYCYIWAAVLDKDAYALFEERGLFDSQTAENLLNHVYSMGNAKDSMGEYRKFRGSEPKVDALIAKRGLG